MSSGQAEAEDELLPSGTEQQQQQQHPGPRVARASGSAVGAKRKAANSMVWKAGYTCVLHSNTRPHWAIPFGIQFVGNSFTNDDNWNNRVGAANMSVCPLPNRHDIYQGPTEVAVPFYVTHCEFFPLINQNNLHIFPLHGRGLPVRPCKYVYVDWNFDLVLILIFTSFILSPCSCWIDQCHKQSVFFQASFTDLRAAELTESLEGSNLPSSMYLLTN